jgi:hypothetical protein
LCSLYIKGEGVVGAMERSNSWFRWWRKKAREGQGQGGRPRHGEKVVVDGSEIRELVEDREAFGMLVDTKFQQLDADGDGMLSVGDLRPAVADIGAALGLPAEGASPNADHVCSEVRTRSNSASKTRKLLPWYGG